MDKISCPVCGVVSYHPRDVEEGYCTKCHWWTSDPVLAPLMPKTPLPNHGLAKEKTMTKNDYKGTS